MTENTPTLNYRPPQPASPMAAFLPAAIAVTPIVGFLIMFLSGYSGPLEAAVLIQPLNVLFGVAQAIIVRRHSGLLIACIVSSLVSAAISATAIYLLLSTY